MQTVRRRQLHEKNVSNLLIAIGKSKSDARQQLTESDRLDFHLSGRRRRLTVSSTHKESVTYYHFCLGACKS